MQITETVCIASDVYRKVLKLMGNRFEISVVADDAVWAHECIEKAVEEIRRIENLLTTFNESSQTNLSTGMQALLLCRSTTKYLN